jgi:hypothetical protein
MKNGTDLRPFLPSLLILVEIMYYPLLELNTICCYIYVYPPFPYIGPLFSFFFV